MWPPITEARWFTGGEGGALFGFRPDGERVTNGDGGVSPFGVVGAESVANGAMGERVGVVVVDEYDSVELAGVNVDGGEYDVRSSSKGRGDCLGPSSATTEAIGLSFFGEPGGVADDEESSDDTEEDLSFGLELPDERVDETMRGISLGV